MDVRIRLPELMKAAGVPTAYALSMRSGERIPMTTAHRLVAAEGAVRYLDANLLDVLCAVFGVPDGALRTREPPPSAGAPGPKPARKRSTAKRATARGRGK